jgi:hypothetical protein
MTEELLHYLWQFRLYKHDFHTTQDGQNMEIIHPGIKNGDAGPDFCNAKIKIGATLWAGNVEIHLKSSDWNRHGHQNDPAYNNVILHVVTEHDTEIQNASGITIPTWKMPIEDRYLDNYRKLMQTSQKIPCSHSIKSISNIEKSTWIERMAIEKMESKVFQISQLLNLFQNDWDEVFYILMARNFGFSVNSDAFEQLARQTPWKIVLKNRDKLETLEALFLGQAGFLSDIEMQDDYIQKLVQEYYFLKKKYELKPLSSHLWKFLRLRPSNFPTIRLMQFAKLLHQNNISLSKITEEENFVDIPDLLSVTPSSYWENHFKPGVEAPKSEKKLGKSSANLIVINTLIPILFAYGKLRGKDDLCNKVLDCFQKLPAEGNSIISDWKKIDILAENAMQSQALIYLYKNYCQYKKCLHCSIGHLVMSKKG